MIIMDYYVFRAGTCQFLFCSKAVFLQVNPELKMNTHNMGNDLTAEKTYTDKEFADKASKI